MNAEAYPSDSGHRWGTPSQSIIGLTYTHLQTIWIVGKIQAPEKNLCQHGENKAYWLSWDSNQGTSCFKGAMQTMLYKHFKCKFWFSITMVTYTTDSSYPAQVLFWVRDHKPKLDQSAVSKITCIWCNEATPPFLSLQIKAFRILETIVPQFHNVLHS